MPGPLARWILSRVVRSGLAFEKEAIDAYRRLLDKVRGSGSCDESLEGGLCHLLAEEEMHQDVLRAASQGRFDELLDTHHVPDSTGITPLEGETLVKWAAELEAALAQEEKTWVFYGNLRRMSKIPAVKRAFEVLASMEKEHIDILRKLLGKA
jgi:rubrerythrin